MPLQSIPIAILLVVLLICAPRRSCSGHISPSLRDPRYGVVGGTRIGQVRVANLVFSSLDTCTAQTGNSDHRQATTCAGSTLTYLFQIRQIHNHLGHLPIRNLSQQLHILGLAPSLPLTAVAVPQIQVIQVISRIVL